MNIDRYPTANKIQLDNTTYINTSLHGSNPFDAIFSDNKISFLVADMGKGKTRALMEWMKRQKGYTSFLFVVHRQLLANAFEQMFHDNGIPVNNYLNKEKKEGVNIVCPKSYAKSIPYISKIKYVIIDELYGNQQISISYIMNKERHGWLSQLFHHVNNQKIVCMDALLCDKKINAILSLSKNKEYMIYHQPILSSPTQLELYDDMKQWRVEIVDAIKKAMRESKCVVVVNTKKKDIIDLFLYLKKYIPELNEDMVMNINADDDTDRKKYLAENNNMLVEEGKVLVGYTPVFSEGSSIDVLDRVSAIFGLFTRKCDVHTIVQLLRRVREDVGVIKIKFTGGKYNVINKDYYSIMREFGNCATWLEQMWAPLYFNENKYMFFEYIAYIYALQYESYKDPEKKLKEICDYLKWNITYNTNVYRKKEHKLLSSTNIRESAESVLSEAIDLYINNNLDPSHNEYKIINNYINRIKKFISYPNFATKESMSYLLNSLIKHDVFTNMDKFIDIYMKQYYFTETELTLAQDYNVGDVRNSNDSIPNKSVYDPINIEHKRRAVLLIDILNKSNFYNILENNGYLEYDPQHDDVVKLSEMCDILNLYKHGFKETNYMRVLSDILLAHGFPIKKKIIYNIENNKRERKIYIDKWLFYLEVWTGMAKEYKYDHLVYCGFEDTQPNINSNYSDKIKQVFNL